jgi:hypothetical protein
MPRRCVHGPSASNTNERETFSDTRRVWKRFLFDGVLPRRVLGTKGSA